MKKKRLLLAPRVLPAAAALLAAVTVSALAAGGDASDPLVSLSHLNGAFLDRLDQQIQQRIYNAGSTSTGTTSSGKVVSWQESLLKERDCLQCSTGSSVLVLAGTVQADVSGTVVDVSTGSTVEDGSILALNHRYLVAEDSSAAFTVTSKTAVADIQGSSSVQYSDAVDYHALAAALKTMHLFRGSLTGFGQGFDLHAAPTRLQALIMFIRVLGEEEAALSYSGDNPFTDVPKGSQGEKYVGYAYSRGYTNGYDASSFRPGQTVSATQYLAFLLRALGADSGGGDLSHTLDDALANGLITAGEQLELQNEPFLRADLVYVSYYALDAPMAQTGRTLRDTLLDRGIFTQTESLQAQTLISSPRK